MVLEEMDGLDGVEYGIEHLALQCSGYIDTKGLQVDEENKSKTWHIVGIL